MCRDPAAVPSGRAGSNAAARRTDRSTNVKMCISADVEILGRGRVLRREAPLKSGPQGRLKSARTVPRPEHGTTPRITQHPLVDNSANVEISATPNVEK